MAISNNNNESVKFICPSADELRVIVNQVRCEECSLIFCNEPRFRMHDLKVHKRKNLDKRLKGDVRYLCPIKDCIYAPNNKKYFTLHKYLKQVKYYISIKNLLYCVVY
jgi:hypothetical protein